jgi:hypothetical protein
MAAKKTVFRVSSECFDTNNFRLGEQFETRQ